MGQKVNPIGLRVGINKSWSSRWFAGKGEFADLLHEDLRFREYIKSNYSAAMISKVVVERFAKKVRITIYAARVGLIIGKKNAELEALKAALTKLAKDKEIFIDVVEVKRPEIDAQLVAENISMQLKRRIGHRRAMKKAIQSAMEMGVEGIKINCSGRLGGAELARAEQYKEGKTPLHTLKANIDYGFAEANTVYGIIGVKVWICHKEGSEELKYAVNAKKGKAQKGSKRS